MNPVQLICTAAVSHNGSTIALLKPVTSEDPREHVTIEFLKTRLDLEPGAIYEIRKIG